MAEHEEALLACRLLVAAYEHGRQRGGSVDWDDVDAAYAAARRALKLPDENGDDMT